jgi:hypothetical protein
MTNPHDNIPEELRQCKAWLVWKLEVSKRTGKKLKVPYYVDGTRRKGTQGEPADRSKLATFDQACKALKAWGSGLGFAMLPDWGLVGLDFDHCVTDGVIMPAVQEVVGATYTEFSPSGTGVHAFVRGALPDEKSHHTDPGVEFGFETFHSTGFLTVTGQVTDVYELSGGGVMHLNGSVPELFEARFGQAATVGVGQIVVHQEKKPEGLTIDQIEEILKWIDPSVGRRTWVNVLMAAHHETSGSDAGLDMVDRWSARSKVKYEGRDDVAERWFSFKKSTGPVRTIGWLRAQAEAAGMPPSDEQFTDLTLKAPDDPEPVPEDAPTYARDKAGDVKPTVQNAVMAVRRPDQVGMRIAHDVFRDELTVSRSGVDEWRPMTDADLVRLRIEMERRRFKSVPKELARDAAVLVAEENQYDSAQVWLRGLMGADAGGSGASGGWDGVPRCERFLIEKFGAEDCAYVRAVGRYLWTALAGRVLDPGCQADMAVVLQGDQGLRKTSGVAALVPARQFFVELDFTKDDDTLARLMRGALVAEISELRGLHTKDHEGIKSFVSRRFEKWTPKYKEFATTFARRCVLIGTTNPAGILSDDTGNRRWLPVHVEKVDVEAVERDRDQMWAEAALMWLGEARGGLPGAPGGVDFRDAEKLALEVHSGYMVDDEWETPIAAWLSEVDGFDLAGVARGETPFTSHDVLIGALGLVTRDVNMLASKRVGLVLRKLGYSRKNCRFGETVGKGWVRVTRVTRTDETGNTEG